MRNAFEMEYHYIGFNQLVDDMSGSWSYCDCVTYLYFLISVFLFTMGFIISVFSMGWFKDTVFANLGHMWMVGPLFMCTAVIFGVRNVLFLRRRRDIDMVIRQQIEDIRSRQAQLPDAQQYSLPIRTVSELTLPPSYEQLIGSHNEGDSDLPPPSYEEAIVSMSKGSTKNDDIIVLNYSVK